MKLRIAAMVVLALVLSVTASGAKQHLHRTQVQVSSPSNEEIASSQSEAPLAGRPLLAMTQSRFIVSPQGPYTTIQSALADANAGDEILVQGGIYRGNLVVNKSVKLIGEDNPVLDGLEIGTVVTLAAEGIEMRGFVVRGSGVEPDQDHAGIMIAAPKVVVADNQLRDVLFGIVVFKASDSVVRGNVIEGKDEYDLGRKGDGVRLWYSPRVSVIGNRVRATRDVVIWYSSDVVLRENIIEHGRYGVHLMYCDGARIEHNRLTDNSVGIYAMYSNNIALRENLIQGQRGPSGYALGFKDDDDVEIADNVLSDNRAGIYLDGTPFSPQGAATFRDNIIAFNDVGVILLPAVRGAVFESNSFWENVEQVAVQGSGALGANRWSGNYWSDYAGFDANGDTVGDVPFRAERFFESMMDREGNLRMLLYSPAVQAIEFAATSFPVVRPQPKFTDAKPRVDPNAIPGFASPAKGNAIEFVAMALGLIALGIMIGAIGLMSGGDVKSKSVFGFDALAGYLRNSSKKPPEGLTPKIVSANEEIASQSEAPLAGRTLATLAPHARPEVSLGSAGVTRSSLRVENVVKAYGKAKALDGITFEARAGEAIALWGPNGAGKTTLLKAILGLIDYQGDIWVANHSVRLAGKQARRNIGYVPQEVAFHDWSVQATMEFYARLKKVIPARIPLLLDQLGLSGHARKPVSALSGGLKQRLALAIALLADPPVLLFDEPTANLDARARADFLALVESLCKNHTIIFASHRIEEVQALADRILVLENGQLKSILTPEELRTHQTAEVELTLWIADAQRAAALTFLQREGWIAHANGRGTVVVQLHPERKMELLRLLGAQNITIDDFQVEGRRAWN